MITASSATEKQDLKILSSLQKKYLEHVDNFTAEMQTTNEKLQREVGLEIYDFK